MTDSEIVAHTISYVKEVLKNAEGGHDWFHIERVFRNTLLIAREEDVDILVVSLGALLHDIADAKFHDGDESLGPKMAREFLSSIAVAPETIEKVENLIANISFKNSFEKQEKPFASKELDVVQDADRLDAIGAIGIARAFHYGGYKDSKLYDPEITPDLNMTRETYKKGGGPTINHFYEKLLLLKDKMNTATAKKIAEHRHQFMLEYLEHFYSEWNGRT